MKKLKLPLIIIIGVLSLILCSIFFINGIQNKAIGLEEQIKTANSDIKVQEKRRVDLLYNLVDTIKAYDKHEYETLKAVVDARKSTADADIKEVKTMLMSKVEAYPNLKANENYKQLMNELSITENMIAQYRSNYNLQIKDYNRYVRKFPNKQFLSILGYESIKYDYLNYDVSSDSPKDLFKEKQHEGN